MIVLEVYFDIFKPLKELKKQKKTKCIYLRKLKFTLKDFSCIDIESYVS